MANSSVVDRHKNRLRARGIVLDRYIQTGVGNGGIIGNPWNINPCGFKFACNDIKAFMLDLISNQSFAVDTGIGQRFQGGASFREVSRPDSLHIIVFKNGQCQELGTRLDYANIHLDSVSPVAGRDPNTRGVIYEPGETINHVLTDLLHLPISISRNPRGFAVTFRF